mmetsp:Transcript_24717/g.82909  ORF Transcript_24717/g.82909 Transcript_24717/m.82909 type:complete len:466 (-) Transcript_24717:105-1502(-)
MNTRVILIVALCVWLCDARKPPQRRPELTRAAGKRGARREAATGGVRSPLMTCAKAAGNDWPLCADVKTHMTVRLFPGYAQRLDGDEWLLSLRGWVMDTKIRSPRRRLTSQALQRGVWTAVHAAGEEQGEVQQPWSKIPSIISGKDASQDNDLLRRARLRKRVSIFLTKCYRWVAVPLQLRSAHGNQLWSTRANSAGHFTVHAAVSEADLLHGSSPARELPGGVWLTTVSTAPTADGRIFSAPVLLIPPVGISVISDIDDTIKETFVHDTRLMLRSTFVEEWKPVPGMPDAYRAWAKRGAVFHYVSSSPWQLQSQLQNLLSKAGFPAGTFHLKDLHYKGRRLFNIFRSSTALKPKQIRKILKNFPSRTFVLVGDCGEKDPQIYADIARRFSDQIEHIYIRNVPNKKVGSMTLEQTRARLAPSFRGVPDSKWTVFECANTLVKEAERWRWPPSRAGSPRSGRRNSH